MKTREQEEEIQKREQIRKDVILRLLNPAEIDAAIQSRIKFKPTAKVIWEFLEKAFTKNELSENGFTRELFDVEDKVTNEIYQRAFAIYAVCAQCEKDDTDKSANQSILKKMLAGMEFDEALDKTKIISNGQALQGGLAGLCAVYDNVQMKQGDGFDANAWRDYDYLRPFHQQLASTELFDWLRKSHYTPLADALIKQDHKLHPSMLKICQDAFDCPDNDRSNDKTHKLFTALNSTAIAIKENNNEDISDCAKQCNKVAKEFHASPVTSLWYRLGEKIKKLGRSLAALFHVSEEKVESRQANFFRKKRVYDTQVSVEIDLINLAGDLRERQTASQPANKTRKK